MLDKETNCRFEYLQDYWHIPFLSIKGQGSESTLVLNPHYYKNLEDFGLPHMYGFPYVSKRWLEKVCADCQLCDPSVDYGEERIIGPHHDEISSYTITRRDYSPKKKDFPLYTTQIFFPEKEIAISDHRSKKICVIDDEQILTAMLSEKLACHGFLTKSIWINPYIEPNPIQVSSLVQEIVHWNTDCLIADVGLGHVNSIDVITRCKEQGIYTIILTGLQKTNETRDIADIFLRGPLPTDTIVQCIP